MRELRHDTERQRVADVIGDAFEYDAWFKKDGEPRRLAGGADEVAKIVSGGRSTFLVAVAEDETCLGACRVDWDPDTGVGHFGMLGVPPRNAGRGVGRAIVRAVCEFLKVHKAQTSISMPVVFSRNERLIRWYEKLGFHKVGDLFQFPVPDIVRAEYAGMILMQQMECSLTTPLPSAAGALASGAAAAVAFHLHAVHLQSLEIQGQTCLLGCASPRPPPSSSPTRPRCFACAGALSRNF